MTKFMKQSYEVKDAAAAVRAANAGKAPLKDIGGYLLGLEIEMRMKHSYAASFPVFILCYALELEHERNAKLRKKVHELKQRRGADVLRLQKEIERLRSERTNADFMNLVKGGISHGNGRHD